MALKMSADYFTLDLYECFRSAICHRANSGIGHLALKVEITVIILWHCCFNIVAEQYSHLVILFPCIRLHSLSGWIDKYIGEQAQSSLWPPVSPLTEQTPRWEQSKVSLVAAVWLSKLLTKVHCSPSQKETVQGRWGHQNTLSFEDCE